MMAAVPKSHWTLGYFRSYVALHPVADTFFYLSSVINPFLYNVSSVQFRQVFMQVLRCRLTIQHVNKQKLQSSQAASRRSLQPLLRRSLRRSRASKAEPGPAQREAPPLPAISEHSDSGIASNTQTSQSPSEAPNVILKANTDLTSETEI